MFGGHKPGVRGLVLSAVALPALLGGGAIAHAGEVHVPAEALAQSLKDIAQQTGANILFAPEAVRGINADALSGSMSAAEAVRRLIAGSKLELVMDGNGGLIVRQAAAAAQPVQAAGVAAPPPPPLYGPQETIIVTGLRGSLQRDLDIKRGSVGLIDAVTMEDTGKFPDSNLATALMRIPGVTVNRAVTSMNGINSTTGDPTQITVRGFGPTFNEALFDGRKIASGVSSRSYDFSALNSDLVQRIEVLKSPNAALSAGAIGATVNIIYPKPFDSPGRRLSASASTTYTPEEGRFTPNGNILFSDTFAGDRIGVLLAGAYAETKSRSNEASVWGWEGTYLDPCQFAAASAPCGATLTPDASRPVWFIQDYGIYQMHDWQMRENAFAVVQWQPSDAVLMTWNLNFSRNDLKERQSGIAIWNNANEMRHVTTSPNGTITDFVRYNTPTDFDAQTNEQVLQSYNTGLNVRWQARSDLILLADLDMALSSLNPGGQFGAYSMDVGYGPSTPSGINGNDIGIAVSPNDGHVLPYYTSWGPNGDPSRFLDPSLIGSHVTVQMSQRNRNLVNQLRLEANWERGNLKITGGVHYEADHMKLANYQDFANNQWQAFAGYGPASNNYYTSGPGAGLPAGVALPPSLFTKSFSTADFIPGWKGDSALPPRVLAYDAAAVIAYLEGLGDPTSPTAVPGFNWGCCNPAYRGKFMQVLDPAIFQHIYEDNFAGYLVATGETRLAGMPARGQLGLRAEFTHLTSTGLQQTPTSLSVMPSDHTAFLVSYGPLTQVRKYHSYGYLLPNLDLNIEPAEDVVVRLDLSRTLTRPPLGNLIPSMIFAASERIGSLVASSGNPGLKPYTADSIDLSGEWYYAPNSYVSLDGFAKNVSDFIVTSTSSATINGLVDPTTTAPAQFRVSSYVNGPNATVYGVELAVQHVFGDSGFGFQANGTLVQSDRPYDPHDLTTSGFAVTGLADSANFVAFYDKDGFQFRIAANWRDSYLDRFGQSQNNSAFGAEPTFVNSSWNMDFSSSYDINEQISAYAEIINLLDSTYSTRGRFPEQVLDAATYGRRITVGLHYRM
jgi:iron complex outermembrane receptor protein